MKNEERAEVAKWHSWWRIGMNIKQSLEIVAIGKAWFSEELMTKTKKSCGMLKSLRPEDPEFTMNRKRLRMKLPLPEDWWILSWSYWPPPRPSLPLSPPDDGPQFKNNPRSLLHSFDMLQWNVAGKM